MSDVPVTKQSLDDVHRAIERLTSAMIEQSGINQSLAEGLTIVSARGVIQIDFFREMLAANSRMLEHLGGAVRSLNAIVGEHGGN